MKTTKDKVLSSVTKRYHDGTVSVTVKTIAQEKGLTEKEVRTAVKGLCNDGTLGREGDMVWLLNSKYLFMKYQSISLTRGLASAI